MANKFFKKNDCTTFSKEERPHHVMAGIIALSSEHQNAL